MNKEKNILRYFLIFLCVSLFLPNSRNKSHVTNAFLGGNISKELYSKTLSENTDNTSYNSFYMSQYFLNLKNNFALNSHGSCNYVALGMLLSYYDTYWDDSFIDEKYEKQSTVNTILENGVPSYNTESPGINRFDYGAFPKTSLDNYISACQANKDRDFQALLFDIAYNFFGTTITYLTEPFGLDFEKTYNLLCAYIFGYKGFSSSSLSIQYNKSGGKTVYDFTVERIRMGYPVLIRSNKLNGHTFIAYDYDWENDILYGHAGIDGLYHIPLGTREETQWYDAIVIMPNYSHKHTNNYIKSETSYCPCIYGEIPNSTALSSDAKRDVAPKVTFNTKYRDVWSDISERKYIVTFYTQSPKTTIFSTDLVGSKSMQLTDQQWNKIIYNQNGYKFYVNIRPYSGINSVYTYTKQLEKPTEYKNATVIDPIFLTGCADSDTYEEYETDNTTLKIKTKNITENGDGSLLLKQYVSSYIFFSFYKAVKSFDVDLSYAQTFVENKNSDIAEIIETHGDVQETAIDFIESGTSLANNTKEYTILHIEFKEPTYRFGIHSSSNRGLRLGQLAVIFDDSSMPLSGSELEYEPEKWNDNDVGKTNCYAYALNTKEYDWLYVNPKSPDIEDGDFGTVEQQYITGVIEDSINYGFSCNTIGKYDCCEPGTYKVVLFAINPTHNDKSGFHWYRQNADGTWSSKNGGSPISNLSLDKKIIYDPEKDPLIDQSRFNSDEEILMISYFAVSPLSYL